MLWFVLLCCVSGSAALQVGDSGATSTGKGTHSALVLGCSLDRNAFDHWCKPRGMESSREFQSRWCADSELNVKLGFMFHPGVGLNGDLDHPFYSGYYGRGPRPPSTRDIIRDAAEWANSTMLLGVLELVVVDSSLWDLALLWVKEGGVTKERMKMWVTNGLPTLLGAVEAAFPTSRIAFRTAPTIRSHVIISKESVDQMYEFVTSAMTGGKLFGKYDVIDFHAIVDKIIEENRSTAVFKHDGIFEYHPLKYPSLLYFNEILKLIGAHPEDPDPEDNMRMSAEEYDPTTYDL